MAHCCQVAESLRSSGLRVHRKGRQRERRPARHHGNMAEELFNRHTVALAGMCASAMDYMIFAYEEKKLFDAPRLPLRPKNSYMCRVSPRPDRFPRLRLGNPSWDSSKCALPRFEEARTDKLDCSQRSDFQSDVRKQSLTPLGYAQRSSKCKETGERKHPRSLSVEPGTRHALIAPRKGRVDLKLSSDCPLQPPKALLGIAVTLNGRHSGKDFGGATISAGKCKENLVPDSPIKRRYKRLLQRTSKAMESELVAGWD